MPAHGVYEGPVKKNHKPSETTMQKIKINFDSTVPKVRQIEDQIRQQIDDGGLIAGEKLPSMRMLAQDLGVSVGISKQALNTLTIEGVLRSDPKVGVFVSRKKPTQDIALILPTVELEQISRIVRSTRESLPENFRLIIEAAVNDFESQIHLLETLNTSSIAGILLLTPPIQRFAPSLNQSLPDEIPCVQVLFQLDGVPTDSSTLDGFDMGEATIDYLIQRGHTEIGLVATDADATTFIQRNHGIHEALKKINKEFKSLPKEIIQAEQLNADNPSFFGKQATLRLMERHPELTAIIGGNGHISLGSIQAIKELGKTIPTDISLISMGIDLSPFQYMTPSITALDAPLEKICRRAVQLLISRIKQSETPPQAIQFPAMLYARNSVKTLAPIPNSEKKSLNTD